MWWQSLGTVNLSGLGPGGGSPTGTNQTMTPSTQPMFRTSTNCPIPNEWLLGAAVVGLVVGYMIWGNR
jgi:hypothetical protein